MNNSESLNKLLDTLLTLKIALRDTAEPCVKEKLDEAINQIQRLVEKSESCDDAQAKALALLGQFLKNLPSIATLIEKIFSD